MITNKQLLNEIKEIRGHLVDITQTNGRILDGWQETLQSNTDLIELCRMTQRTTREEVTRKIIADMRKQIQGYENIDIILDRIEKKYTGSGDTNDET